MVGFLCKYLGHDYLNGDGPGICPRCQKEVPPNPVPRLGYNPPPKNVQRPSNVPHYIPSRRNPEREFRIP